MSYDDWKAREPEAHKAAYLQWQEANMTYDDWKLATPEDDDADERAFKRRLLGRRPWWANDPPDVDEEDIDEDPREAYLNASKGGP